jgi:predicted amidohydrolase YtcJ
MHTLEKTRRWTVANRREFLALIGAGFAGPVAAADGPEVDLVVFNAKVYTVDSRAPKVKAFSVKAGRSAAVGSTAEMRAFIGKGAQTIDARQMTIVPEFIDCHNHAPGSTLLYDVVVGNPYVVAFVTISRIVEKLRAKAQQAPPGMSAEGYFFFSPTIRSRWRRTRSRTSKSFAQS